MNERIFELSNVQPKDFSGQENKHIELLKQRFPKLKIIARGNLVKVYGIQKEIGSFELIFEKLMQVYESRRNISTEIFEQIIEGNIADKQYQPDDVGILIYGVSGKPIKARTSNQQQLINTVAKNDMVFAIGPAGTGKTYTSIAIAVKALKNKQVKKIILTRPAVEAGENLGFLPGDLKEKLDPYMQPLYDALYDMIPHTKLEDYIEARVIEIAPLAFMRGRTLDDAFVILDEAQNTIPSQMKMFLTRMGTTAKFIITGDPGQIDLPPRVNSGLKEAVAILKNIKGVGITHLSEKDVVRHPIVKQIVMAYKNYESN